MDKLAKKRLYAALSPITNQISDYGEGVARSITSKMLIEGGLMDLDVKAHRLACTNMAIAGRYIAELMFKAKPVRTSLYTNRLTTIGGSAISLSNLPPLPNKETRLSNIDRVELMALFDKIEAAVILAKTKIYAYENKSYQMSFFELSRLTTEMMQIDSDLWDIAG